jgi:hypothetical protein
MNQSAEENHLDEYGDPGIASFDKHVPLWLKVTYVLLPILGFFWFYMYWNGSTGWLDRGYWNQLERAANTTFPIINQNDP